MNRLWKVVLLGLLLLFGVKSQAAVDVRTLDSGTNYVLLSTGGYVVDSVVAVTDTNLIIRLYDHADAGLTNVTAAYTNWAETVTNYVRTWVTSTGITNSVTNTVKLVTSNAVDAATNAVTAAHTYAAPAGAVTTFPYPFVVAKGLVVSNDVGCTLLITYRGM